MLTRLRLRDFVIAREVDLELRAGLTCFTGETGAGKSILAHALGLALGDRAQSSVVRSGRKRAVIEVLFEDGGGGDLRRRLDSVGLEEDDQLLVRREIRSDGRGRVDVNGAPVTVTMLRALTEGLVEITGQGDHHALLRPATHEALLDAFADLHERRAQVQEAYREYADTAEELRALAVDDRDRLARLDLLRFQLDEIEAARIIDDGELDRLDGDMVRLRSAEKLRRVAVEAANELYEQDGSAADVLGRTVLLLEDAATTDLELSPWASELASAREIVAEVARELSRYAERTSADPAQLAEREERVSMLRHLCRKHGGDLAAVRRRADAMGDELAAMEQRDSRLAALEERLAEARRKGTRTARALTRARKKASPELAGAVMAELAHLGMAEARFQVAVEAKPAPHTDEDEDDGVIPPLVADGARVGPTGRDRVAFQLAANPGEAAGPLARIASGGERARVALAVNLVLAERDPAMTYVLDEVDVGVGGRTATAVAERLRTAGVHRQMLCITHQPQLAAVAEHHFKVEKARVGEGTRTEVRSLPAEERTEEIARMLGGARVTARTRAHAQEMLRR